MTENATLEAPTTTTAPAQKKTKTTVSHTIPITRPASSAKVVLKADNREEIIVLINAVRTKLDALEMLYT
jgi:hypothetical protein